MERPRGRAQHLCESESDSGDGIEEHRGGNAGAKAQEVVEAVDMSLQVTLSLSRASAYDPSISLIDILDDILLDVGNTPWWRPRNAYSLGETAPSDRAKEIPSEQLAQCVLDPGCREPFWPARNWKFPACFEESRPHGKVSPLPCFEHVIAGAVRVISHAPVVAVQGPWVPTG
jgi:hypothetical protein